jgi:transposase-like protein
MGAGWYHCCECREKFTVRTGTLYERSHIPLHKWLLATHLLTSSKKGISAHQLFRMLGFGSYRTAWFMAHRIREGMRPGNLSPVGGSGRIVEVDETFTGRKPDVEVKQGAQHKRAVLSLVERGGSVRSFHIDEAKASDIMPIIRANLDRETHVMTDEASYYRNLGKEFAHDTVRHSIGEYGYTKRKTGTKGPHKHCRRILFNFQKRNERSLSTLFRETLAPLPCRVRFPSFQPLGPWR